MKPDRDECRRDFLTHRSSYEGLMRRIAMATLMPIDELGFSASKVDRLT